MWTDNETKEDLLGFEIHANLIKSIATDDTLLPTTIGVFGDWGSGKSSIMKILNSSFDENDDVICLYFNGWVFEGYDDAKAALIESILKQLSENKKITTNVKDKFKELAKNTDWFRVGKLGIKGVAGYLSGGATLIPDLVKKIEELSTDPEKLLKMVESKKIGDLFSGIINKNGNKNENIKFIREFREKFNDLIIESNIKNLIVLIDDLDRCTPERIIDNLEAIKLFLNVDKTAFVIGADPRIVSHAIELRYGKNTIENDEIKRLSNDYLEKIIQVPYNLPKLSDSEVKTFLVLLFCKKNMDQKTFDKILKNFKIFREKDKYSVYDITNIKTINDIYIDEKTEKELSIIPKIAPLISKNLKGNPRQIKRFLNAYTLRKRLAEVANLSKNFKDDVMIKLMVLEYLHEDKFRKLYDWQSTQDGIPKEINNLETFVKKGEPFSEKFKNWEKDTIKNWLKIEPSLINVDLRDYFWLTRDKLKTSIESKLLISPIVKNYYIECKDAPSSNIRKKIIEKICGEFTEGDFEIFFKLITQETLRNQKEDSNYLILIELIEKRKSYAEGTLLEILNKVSLGNLSASIAHSINEASKKSPEIKNWVLDKIESKEKNIFIKTLVAENNGGK